MGVQRAECNARFKAEEPEPLAQLAERISGGARKSCRGPELAPSSSPGELAKPLCTSSKQVGKSRQSLRISQGPGLPLATPRDPLHLEPFPRVSKVEVRGLNPFH